MPSLVRETAAAIIAAVAVSLFGYLLVIRDNHTEIRHLKQDLSELKASVGQAQENGDNQIDFIKLVIAANHPQDWSRLVSTATNQSQIDRAPLASTEKLQLLAVNEINLLADSLTDLEAGDIQFNENDEVVTAPPALAEIIDEYDFNRDDLIIYSQIIDSSAAINLLKEPEG